jgi:ribosomal-protein-alanine N-acetyltransferase
VCVVDGEAYFLTTPRLGFRSWRAGDLDLAMSLWGDPRVTALIDARGRLTRDQVRQILEREIGNQRREGVQYWPLFLLDSGAFVGCCGLKPHHLESGLHEFGFHLRFDFWRRGYATEAGEAVLAHARDALGLSRLVAGHHPENHASRRVLEKLGFRYLRDELFAGTGLVHPLYEVDLRRPGPL